MSCLELRIEKLNSGCQHEIFRIREIQGEDYHLDPELFFSCREDRENLCKEVESGQGRVYACLFENKFNAKMSNKCREVLTLRQRLRNLDSKIDNRFIEMCHNDILKHECSRLPNPEKHFSNELTSVMMCLEVVEDDFRSGLLDHGLEPECTVELDRLKKELISDYKINSEIVSKCDNVISRYCSHVSDLRGGSVIHCIMGILRDPKTTQQVPKDCSDAVHDIIKASDIVEDVRLDPMISKACAPLLSSECSKENTGDDDSQHKSMKALTCLSEHSDSPKMTEECSKALAELNYFFVRDLSLDTDFKVACKADAERHCHVSKGDWKSSHGLEPMTINCLWQLGPPNPENPSSNDDHLSPKCFKYLYGLMELDAQYFDLHPFVFKECLVDAIEHCSNAVSSVHTKQNLSIEMNENNNVLYCLEVNIKNLRPNCMEAIEQMSTNIEQYPTLNSQIRLSCSSILEKYCMAHANSQENSLKCLIEHKNEMNPVCRGAVDHIQFMLMEDLQLSTEFRESCANDRKRLCGNLPKPVSTHSVIKCLMTYKIAELAELEGQTRIMTKVLEPKCSKMLQFELYQQHEMIKLDPEVTKHCLREIKMLCPTVQDHGGKLLSCLRQKSNDLGVLCHRVIFAKEIEESQDSSIDIQFMERCQIPIRLYCPAHKLYSEDEGIRNDIFFCLMEAFKFDQQKEHFSKDCRIILKERVEEYQTDYRLDPVFIENCKPDMEKFCKAEHAKKEGDFITYRGKIIQCMRKAFMFYSHDVDNGVTDSKYAFTSSACVNDIENHIALSNLNYHFDPYLRDACKNEIPMHCSSQLVREDDDKDALYVHLEGSITECLKNALVEKKSIGQKCKEEISRKIDESRDDVSSDFLLMDACSDVLATKCRDVKAGKFRQMNCLLYLSERRELTKRCYVVVKRRMEMWDNAVKPISPESLSDLYQLISGSAVKNFFISAFGIVVLLILCLGVLAGRVTKRVPVDLKMR